MAYAARRREIYPLLYCSRRELKPTTLFSPLILYVCSHFKCISAAERERERSSCSESRRLAGCRE